MSNVAVMVTGRPGSFMTHESVRELFFDALVCNQKWTMFLVHDGSSVEYVNEIQERFPKVVVVECDYDGRMGEIEQRTKQYRGSKKKHLSAFPDYIQMEFDTENLVSCWRQWYQMGCGMKAIEKYENDLNTKFDFIARVRPDAVLGRHLCGIVGQVIQSWRLVSHVGVEDGHIRSLACGGSEYLFSRHREGCSKAAALASQGKGPVKGHRSRLFVEGAGLSGCFGGAYVFENDVSKIQHDAGSTVLSINDWIIVAHDKMRDMFRSMHTKLFIDSEALTTSHIPGGLDTWAPEALLHELVRSAGGVLCMHCGSSMIARWTLPKTTKDRLLCIADYSY